MSRVVYPRCYARVQRMSFFDTLLGKVPKTGDLFPRFIVSEKDGPAGKQGFQLDVSAQLSLALSNVDDVNRAGPCCWQDVFQQLIRHGPVIGSLDDNHVNVAGLICSASDEGAKDTCPANIAEVTAGQFASSSDSESVQTRKGHRGCGE
jgi:hypothetical protein